MQIPEPGLRTHDRERATPGLTLFSPIRGDRVFLIDMDGQPVHEWKLQGLGGINRCRLTDDGNLFVAQATSEGPPLMAGKGGLLREYDWDGAIVWEHYDENHHHDARRLGNGNTLYIAWDPLDDATAGRVQGGLPGTEKDGKIYGDLVREIDPAGNTVWEWRIRDIEIEKYPICGVCDRSGNGARPQAVHRLGDQHPLPGGVRCRQRTGQADRRRPGKLRPEPGGISPGSLTERGAGPETAAGRPPFDTPLRGCSG